MKVRLKYNDVILKSSLTTSQTLSFSKVEPSHIATSLYIDTKNSVSIKSDMYMHEAVKTWSLLNWTSRHTTAAARYRVATVWTGR